MRLFFFAAAELMAAFLSKVVVVVVVKVVKCSCLGFLTSRVEIRGKEWSRMVGLISLLLVVYVRIVLCRSDSSSTLSRE